MPYRALADTKDGCALAAVAASINRTRSRARTRTRTRTRTRRTKFSFESVAAYQEGTRTLDLASVCQRVCCAWTMMTTYRDGIPGWYTPSASSATAPTVRMTWIETVSVQLDVNAF